MCEFCTFCVHLTHVLCWICAWCSFIKNKICEKLSGMERFKITGFQQAKLNKEILASKCYCFTVHFDSLNLIHTNQRTSSYKDVLVF